MKFIDFSNFSMNPINRGSYESNKNYALYSKPLVAKLYETLKIGVHYQSGLGNWLKYQNSFGKLVEVLDSCGGYGANLLGHNHKELKNTYIKLLEANTVFNGQLSKREKAGDLSKAFCDLLAEETSIDSWTTHLSNSGAESVEAALKHSLLYYETKIQKFGITLNKELKQLREFLILNPQKIHLMAHKVSFIIHNEVSNDIDSIIKHIHEYNMEQFSRAPKFIAIEGSFHGKTLGALGVTSSENYRFSFGLQKGEQRTIFLSKEDLSLNQDKILAQTVKIIRFQANHDEIIKLQDFSLIAASIVETIQGEAGVFPLSKDLLCQLRKHANQNDYLMISDEVQAGLYRTGTLCSLSHHDITADIYCFSKGLGGGLVKLGASVINSKKYCHEFGLLHTSTFSEDDYSSIIGLKVLEILKYYQQKNLSSKNNIAEELKSGLTYLHKKFPQLISEVRGKGFMLALEFNLDYFDHYQELRPFIKANMLGYLLASAALNHQNLRIIPTLSSNLTFRIQLSLLTESKDVQSLLKRLVNFCDSLQSDMGNFLFGHLFEQKVGDLTPFNYQKTQTPYPKAYFLCHTIDGEHFKTFSPAFKNLPAEKIEKLLSNFLPLAEFINIHQQVLENDKGEKIEVNLMAAPITTKQFSLALKNREHREMIVHKIQKVIDQAQRDNVSVIGLGQFTSIISQNGTVLNPKNMSLTTGNAFTTALTYRAALRLAEKQNIQICDSTIGLVGAAGNIISTLACLVSQNCGHMKLFYHTSVEQSTKLQLTIKKIIKYAVRSKPINDFKYQLRSVMEENKLDNDQALINAIVQGKFNHLISVETNFEQLQLCDVVMIGTNSTKKLFKNHFFKQNAVVIDTSVPTNIDPELATQRPDLAIGLGGVAMLPQTIDNTRQNLNATAFPLNPAECFACMAETFTLAFESHHNKESVLHIGSLTADIVQSINKLAYQHGFRLGSDKKELPI